MPWMIPAHPAPVLALKELRPAAFSGLALVLGAVAPDLAFMLRLDTDSVAAHTFAGQLYVTVPFVLVLHALATSLVLPWLLPRLPSGAPFYPEELAAVRKARGPRDWARIAFSGWVGGTTHVLLDGITHGNRSGWALAFLPVLRSPATHPGGGTVPLHDALHAWLSLVLGVAAIATWRRLARERRLWTWRGEEPREVARASAAEHRRLWMWVVTLALVGALTVPELRQAQGVRFPELAAYGAVAFVIYGILLLAAGHRLRRWHWTQLRARRAPSPARS
jgi:hypothetical protein